MDHITQNGDSGIYLGVIDIRQCTAPLWDNEQSLLFVEFQNSSDMYRPLSALP